MPIAQTVSQSAVVGETPKSAGTSNMFESASAPE